MALLDTCVLIWLTSDQAALSPVAVETIRSRSGRLFVSAISGFEIALLCAKGRLKLPRRASDWFEDAIERHGLTEIPLTGRLAAEAADLPRLHSDPADRFIVATAMAHRLEIVTPDTHISRYEGIETIW